MDLDLKIRRHPGKQALVAYAENLVDNHRGIDRTIAAHLSTCPACHAEVKAMQASLSLVASAPALEPTSDMTAQILMAGKQARSEMKRRTTPMKAAWKALQVASCAAAVIAVAGLTFSAFLDAGTPETAPPAFGQAVPPMALSPDVSPEALRKAAVEVAAEGEAISAAIRSKHGDSLSPQELEQLRVVQARSDDIAAAVSALERNPQNVRAMHVVHANLDSLRSMYVEGGSL